MTDTQNFNMVYALNSYLWKVLEANHNWDVTDYGNRPPIIPGNQQPEFLQYDKPFIVYGSSTQTELVPYQEVEVVAYTIFATTATEANSIMRTVLDAFRGMDESAKNINDWVKLEGLTRTGGRRKVTFQSVSINNATSSGPERQEGGRVDAQVMLTVRFNSHGDTMVKVEDFAP